MVTYGQILLTYLDLKIILCGRNVLIYRKGKRIQRFGIQVSTSTLDVFRGSSVSQVRDETESLQVVQCVLLLHNN